MTWTLLSNDDGVDSPALAPFARALGRRRQVSVVVPDRERSWVGKAITRFEPIEVRTVERFGIPMHTCTGYPADAVQLGIDGLFDAAPELVVSGINLGYNHGVGFMLSSGTVGAAIEGWVSGVRAIAFSTGTTEAEWKTWRQWVETDEARRDWERLSELCAALTDEICASGIFDVADVVSVNLPFAATPETERRVTGIARVGYDRLFSRQRDGTFVHDFGGGIREFGGLNGTDVSAAKDGAISITPIRMPAAPETPPAVRRALE